MKYKTTRKQVIENSGTIIYCGYCDIQHLLSCEQANAYTCGVYGWNADIYHINGVTIVTGYRPFGNVRTDYKTNSKYDNKARTIVNNWELSYEERKNQLAELITEYIKEVLNNA